MYKKRINAFAGITLMSLVLTTAFTTGFVKAAGSVTQIGGSTRYETAAKVAAATFANSDTVVLVSGEGYADSVSASVLAKKLDAPILLTGSQMLDSNAEGALEKLKPKNVYIIGGTGSISRSIEDGLKASNYKVTRLGGTTRYETNLAIANKLVDLGVSKDNIIAVSGTNFSDALSAAPVAAADGDILLLTNNDLSSIQKTIDFAKNSNVTVVGTTTVVSDSIYNALNADRRVNGGSDRFATNLNVLKAFDSDLKNDKIYVANSSENSYSDPLIASAAAGKYSAPLILIDTEGSNVNAIDYIKTKAAENTEIEAIGGTGVIPASIVNEINSAISEGNTMITFKDKNLEQAVRLAANKPTGILYKSDVDKVLEVNFYYSKIKDISGIENLTSLQKLGLGGNQITDIGAIKSLTNLRRVEFSSNQISDISPLKNLINLQELALGDNQISNINSLGNMTNLQTLILYRNSISDISPLKNLNNLQILNLSMNSISDISPLKNLTNLQTLDIGKNNIKDISPLKNLTNLKELRISEGQLSDNEIDSLKSALPNLKITVEYLN